VAGKTAGAVGVAGLVGAERTDSAAAGWFAVGLAATPFVLVTVGPRSAVEGNPALPAALAVAACIRFGPAGSAVAGWTGQVRSAAAGWAGQVDRSVAGQVDRSVAGPKRMVGVELVDWDSRAAGVVHTRRLELSLF